jgi:hypothetical protein
MTKLTYKVVAGGKTTEVDTYAEALRLKGETIGAMITRVYSPIPEERAKFAKIKRVVAR